MSNNKLSVTVRMYRQGLGDCFLLTFRRGEQTLSNMLIDCGLFLGTKNGKEIMVQVANDIRETAQTLNAVVLTHEHWDHISGFSLAKKVFDDANFKFNEVWVGWTENENDEKFKQVRERFRKQKKGLRIALNEMKSEKLNDLSKTVDALVNKFFGEETNTLGMSGSDIWKYVLDKSVVQPPKYCNPGEIHKLDGVEGVRIYILGPPEDIELLDDEETPEDETYRKHLRLAISNSFLAAATGDDDSLFDSEAFLPFDGEFKIPLKYAEKHPDFGGFFKENYGFSKKEPNEWRRIDEDWLQMAGELALNIDGITNNTCLAIAIELIDSGKVLLFPGDAQFGNWKSWQKLKWEIRETNGKKEIKINDLLKKTAFYKVGHHGSHNATLKKSGLEVMEHPELVAMIPTNQDFAKNQITEKTPKGWKMPEKELLKALEKKAKGRVILADEYGGNTDEKKHLKDRCSKQNLSKSEFDNFLKKVTFSQKTFVRDKNKSNTPEPLYVEYTIED